jgi:hypothetical protein
MESGEDCTTNKANENLKRAMSQLSRIHFMGVHFTGVHASLIAEIINSRSYLRVQFTCESYLPCYILGSLECLGIVSMTI